MAQICSSGWVFPKAGIPVMLTPFLAIQNTSTGSFCRFAASKSGGDGSNPWEILDRVIPGAPWHTAQLSRKKVAPDRKFTGFSRSGGGTSPFEWYATDSRNVLCTAQATNGLSGPIAETL